MSELIEEFNKIKNQLYKKDLEKLSLTELAELITKKNKTQEEVIIIKKIYLFTNTIKKALIDFGTKIIEINTDVQIIASENFSEIKETEQKIKEILFLLDVFIDALSAIIRVYKYKESRFDLKKIEYYLKALRNKLLVKTNEYRLTLIKNDDIEKEIKLFLNDIIDIVIRFSYKLRILKLHDKLKEIIKNDRKFNNN